MRARFPLSMALLTCAAAPGGLVSCAGPGALLSRATPALTDVTISDPNSGAKVVSPFGLAATATPCSAQPIAAMGYWFDHNTATTIFYSPAISTTVSAPIGTHTLHVKSWGNQGASCIASIPITVIPSANSLVPSNAIAVTGIQALGNWQASYDSATGVSATGLTSIVNSPSISGYAREFQTTYSNDGGERYYVVFGQDRQASNFLYDAWIYLAAPAAGIANIEMDMNQVTAHGRTTIYGLQCDGNSGTWDYTLNAGTPQNPIDQWRNSSAQCNPRDWSTNTWHHVQFTYSGNSGSVTYKSVWLDNVEQDLNVTVPSSFSLAWDPVLLTNFQVDGLRASGSSTVYLDNLIVYRW